MANTTNVRARTCKVCVSWTGVCVYPGPLRLLSIVFIDLWVKFNFLTTSQYMFTRVLGSCTARYAKATAVKIAAVLPASTVVSAAFWSTRINQQRFRKSTSHSRQAAVEAVRGEPHNPFRDTSASATRRRHERQASKRQRPTSQEDFAKATMSYQQRQYPNLVRRLSFFSSSLFLDAFAL